MNSLMIAIGIIMVILAIMDWFAAQKGEKEYKSTIVALGILGTFLGVVIGLWHFDVENIDTSVPELLQGLKFAFITSILGLSISISLKMRLL